MSDFNLDPTFTDFVNYSLDSTMIDPAGIDQTSVENALLEMLFEATGVGMTQFQAGISVKKTHDREGRAFAAWVVSQIPPTMQDPLVIAQIDLRTLTKYLEENPNVAPEASKYVVDKKLTSRLTDHYVNVQLPAFDNVNTNRSDDDLREAIANETNIADIPEAITFNPAVSTKPEDLRATVLGVEPSAETLSADDPASEPVATNEGLTSFAEMLAEARGGTAASGTNTISVDDFKNIFTFDDTFASAAQLFSEYQLQSILGLDEGAIQEYKFRWTEDVPPTERMAAQGVTMNLLELRKMLRTMEPKHVAALSDKLAIAGYYERVGAEGPLIDGNGNDVVFQRAVSELVYDSVAQGGAAITTVLNNQLQQRLENVNQKFREASLTGLQQQVMEYGTYVLGRPLTPEQAMEAIRSLPEFRETYVEEQLAAGVPEETILAAPAELDDAESSQLLQYVYDANKREAQRFGANNWASLFADEAKRRKAGAQSGRELPFGVAEGTRAQDITVGDVTGDSGD